MQKINNPVLIHHIMLRRKAYDELMRWKENADKPLLVYGQRQVGKTFIIEQFAKDNFKNYIYANLNEDGRFRSIFEQSDRTVDNIILSISTVRGIEHIDDEDTLIFLDEIQDCPEALSSLKSFKKDGRYRVIASGSMLGLTENLVTRKKKNGVVPEPISPMGDAKVMQMTSLDFEEFLWANGIPQKAIDKVRDFIKNQKEIDKPLFEQFSNLFRFFQITGGMPASVQEFVNDKSTFARSSDELEDIVSQIGRDITKYNTPENAIKTMECFRSIPYQLAGTNKKFQYSRISPNTISPKNTRKAADTYMENLLWIKHAGYGNFCYGLTEIASPVKNNIKTDVFKIYLSDTGILTHMYGDMAVKATFSADTSYNMGSIVENAVAESLMKCGLTPTYYVNNKGQARMEIDFVVELFTGLVAIEVKSGKDRNGPSINKVTEHFKIDRRVMLEDSNIYIDDKGIEHYPLFVSAFFDSLDNKPGYL